MELVPVHCPECEVLDGVEMLWSTGDG